MCARVENHSFTSFGAVKVEKEFYLLANLSPCSSEHLELLPIGPPNKSASFNLSAAPWRHLGLISLGLQDPEN